MESSEHWLTGQPRWVTVERRRRRCAGVHDHPLDQSPLSLTLSPFQPDYWFFFLLCTTGISEYQSIEGDSVSLPCNITAGEWNEAHISLIVWYRSGNLGNPIYSIDARNSLTSSRHQVIAELNGRARMDFTSRPPVLVMDSVKAEDAGDYRCRVDYRKNRTQQFLIHLNVSGKWQAIGPQMQTF